MRDSDFKRVKHRSSPGDLGRQQKIAMRSKPVTSNAKSFNNTIRDRTRAVLKERTRAEIDISSDHVVAS